MRLEDIKIYVGNGHGVDTGGKRSPDGTLREYAYTRDVADIIVAILRSDGYNADLLVPEEKDISLAERVNRVNKECIKRGADKVIYVSVHLNAAGHGKEWSNATGWSAYTTKGQTKSDILADYLYREAMKEFPTQTFRKDLSDGDYDKEEDFYVLRKSKCVAVLTENFFQDSKKDYAFLLESKTQARIAMVHVRAIKAYIKAYYPNIVRG